ncbi:ATV_HP_G0015040.mRNA.1.CDS.1 [Saccharomyces cerevisiae]|nr:ATV_HP_G0015040.mRNA.1.CDS.1 [Saccharomyces cerevisiae]CAI6950011.1 ATV_HP_G0015040.mRNA.1.CDS.1 [Saccharomyces cerevisiae]
MLQNQKVFRLVPEYDVERSKLDLIEEVEPLVRTLGDKLRKSMGRMQRELDALQQTYELNDLRLKKNISMDDDDALNSPDMGQKYEGRDADDVVMMASSTNEELEELKKLKKKKKQLENKLEILKTEIVRSLFLKHPFISLSLPNLFDGFAIEALRLFNLALILIKVGSLVDTINFSHSMTTLLSKVTPFLIIPELLKYGFTLKRRNYVVK